MSAFSSESFRQAGDRPPSITTLLKRFASRAPGASGELMDAVQWDLRRIAASCIGRERRNFPLEPTELVSRMYLSLTKKREKDWTDRKHFFRFSYAVMSHSLIDENRRDRAKKRPDRKLEVPVDEVSIGINGTAEEELLVSDLLERLNQKHPSIGAVIQRRCEGLSDEEIAQELQVCSKTVARRLVFAKAWVSRELHRAV
jgi:RNA polymerase sigma factor (TIGR02999 family)